MSAVFHFLLKPLHQQLAISRDIASTGSCFYHVIGERWSPRISLACVLQLASIVPWWLIRHSRYFFAPVQDTKNVRYIRIAHQINLDAQESSRFCVPDQIRQFESYT